MSDMMMIIGAGFRQEPVSRALRLRQANGGQVIRFHRAYLTSGRIPPVLMTETHVRDSSGGSSRPERVVVDSLSVAVQ